MNSKYYSWNGENEIEADQPSDSLAYSPNRGPRPGAQNPSIFGAPEGIPGKESMPSRSISTSPGWGPVLPVKWIPRGKSVRREAKSMESPSSVTRGTNPFSILLADVVLNPVV